MPALVGAGEDELDVLVALMDVDDVDDTLLLDREDIDGELVALVDELRPLPVVLVPVDEGELLVLLLCAADVLEDEDENRELVAGAALLDDDEEETGTTKVMIHGAHGTFVGPNTSVAFTEMVNPTVSMAMIGPCMKKYVSYSQATVTTSPTTKSPMQLTSHAVTPSDEVTSLEATTSLQTNGIEESELELDDDGGNTTPPVDEDELHGTTVIVHGGPYALPLLGLT